MSKVDNTAGPNKDDDISFGLEIDMGTSKVRPARAHFPFYKGSDPMGKCARQNDSLDAVNTQVHFSYDISAQRYPKRYDLRGLMPVEQRDPDGNLVRDENGSVKLSPRFKRVRARGAQWIDEVILSVMHLLPTSTHIRVLLALHAMTNSLKYNDINPQACWCEVAGKVVADDGSTDGTCAYSVPTLCVRIPDLSYENVSRFLHPDRDAVLEQLRADAERSGMSFDTHRANELLRDDGIVEAEFLQVIDELTQIGVLAVLDEDGQRVGVLNHLSMAQCTPTMRLTMLQGAPMQGVMTDAPVRDADRTTGGVVKPDSKKRSQGNRALRERIGQLSSSNKQKDRAIAMMERHHAEDRAAWREKNDENQMKVTEVLAENTELRALLAPVMTEPDNETNDDTGYGKKEELR